MIQITPQMRILVAIEAVDVRKGIDSLARLCRDKLQADPFSGSLFVFRSRRGASIRILVYDGQGFWLAQKGTRFISEQGTKMGRRSLLHVEVQGEDDGINIGGHVTPVAEAVMTLESFEGEL